MGIAVYVYWSVHLFGCMLMGVYVSVLVCMHNGMYVYWTVLGCLCNGVYTCMCILSAHSYFIHNHAFMHIYIYNPIENPAINMVQHRMSLSFTYVYM